MKKILIFAAGALLFLLPSCEDKLDVNPTESVSGTGMMDNASSALKSINGIYRYMFLFAQSTDGGNSHQDFGPQSYSLMAEMMGEDLIMAAPGNGWFWYDYIYDVKRRYTSGTWRSYTCWNFYYTIISNVNYILDAEETMAGDSADVDYIMGQAYALRAYCYHQLALIFCRTYEGHTTDKGVPIYTTGTESTTQGKPRGTLAEVYAQVTEDIEKAVALLKTTNGGKNYHISHMDYAVANVIKARIYMTMGNWDSMLTASREAQKRTGTSIGEGDAILSGFNDRTAKNVLWAFEIITEQGTTNPQFFAHMDADQSGSYASSARKCVSTVIYNLMGANDVRRAWWNPNNTAAKYQQEKFKFADLSAWSGDRILIRFEEAVLMEAEALCRLGQEGEARQVLNTFMAKRDPNYNTEKTGTAMGAMTTTWTGSLLEEIINQRRIELWGEYGRVWDVKRLKQGFVRTSEMGHPAAAYAATNTLKVNNTETWDWVMTLPKVEFDANPSLDEKLDQNPEDSGI